MSRYVENNLGRGEEIVLKAKKSFWCVVPQIVWFVLMVVLFFVLKNVLSEPREPENLEELALVMAGETLVSPIVDYLWILIIVGLIPLIIRLIVLWGMNLAVTNKRVIGKIGVLKIQALDYHIEKVDNVSLKAGFLGNLFHYHTVVVKGGGDNAEIKFIGISNANQFKNAINEAIEKHADEARKQQAAEIAKAMGR